MHTTIATALLDHIKVRHSSSLTATMIWISDLNFAFQMSRRESKIQRAGSDFDEIHGAWKRD